MDEFCDKEKIEHRLTKPNHPQTNGMVEKVNDTIKNGTILIEQYPNKNAMESSLKKFLLFYILHRRHGGIYKELKLRTPMQALDKWYELRPEIFIKTPKRIPSTIRKIITLAIIKYLL